MKIDNIGSRGVLFTFEASESPIGNCSVYMINGEKNIYLCDTHLGPESMKPVKEYLSNNGLDHKPLVIFFSHSDWDHIWGACAFEGATVVAHEKCPQRIFDRGNLDLEKNSAAQNGAVKLVYPNLTFDSRLSFREDGVEFFYAPGHTIDSAVCYDRKDSVLFVGDLVERPRPVICHHDLETYIETLDLLRTIAAEVMVSSHSKVVTDADIEENIQYLQHFHEIALSTSANEDENYEDNDEMIRKLYLLLMYEDAIQQSVGESFDYQGFQKEFWGSLDMDYLNSTSALLRSIGFDDLKLALESHMVEL